MVVMDTWRSSHGRCKIDWSVKSSNPWPVMDFVPSQLLIVTLCLVRQKLIKCTLTMNPTGMTRRTQSTI